MVRGNQALEIQIAGCRGGRAPHSCGYRAFPNAACLARHGFPFIVCVGHPHRCDPGRSAPAASQRPGRSSTARRGAPPVGTWNCTTADCNAHSGPTGQTVKPWPTQSVLRFSPSWSPLVRNGPRHRWTAPSGCAGTAVVPAPTTADARRCRRCSSWDGSQSVCLAIARPDAARCARAVSRVHRSAIGRRPGPLPRRCRP